MSEIHCTACKSPVGADMKFCPNCGARFSEDVESPSFTAKAGLAVRRLVALVILGVVLYVGYVMVFSPSKDELLASARDTSKVTAEYADQYKEFYQYINRVNLRADKSWGELEEGLKILDMGAITVTELYALADRAKKDANRAWMEINQVKMPKGISDELGALCIQIKDCFGVAHSAREDAAKHLMAYLDARKPSELQAFKEEINTTREFASMGKVDLVTGLRKVGATSSAGQRNN